MIRFLLLTVGLCGFAAVAHGQSAEPVAPAEPAELVQARGDYAREVDAARAEFERRVEHLRAAHLRRLDALIAQATRRGDADAAAALQAEREAIAATPLASLLLGEDEADDDLSPFLGREWVAIADDLRATGDPAVVALLERDVAGGDTAEVQRELGDAWWDWAESQEGDLRAAALGRARHWYGPIYAQVDEQTREALKPRIIAASLAGRPRSERRWTVVFRSDQPRHWNTALNTPADLEFARDLRPLAGDQTIRYIRLSRLDSDESVILPFDRPASQLDDHVELPGGLIWNGRKDFDGKTVAGETVAGAYRLGIANRNWTHEYKDGAAIAGPKYGYGGWGFGRPNLIKPHFQAHLWNDRTMGIKVFEIAVTTGRLTEAEEARVIGAESVEK